MTPEEIENREKFAEIYQNNRLTIAVNLMPGLLETYQERFSSPADYGIAEEAIDALGLSDVEIEYTRGARGWRGDVPRVLLATQKLADLGWKTTYDSDGAVRVAAQALAAQMRPANTGS